MIAAIENAILKRLKDAADAGVLGYKYGMAESYPTDWDVYLADKAITFPAIWAVFGGATPDVSTTGSTTFKAQFGLVVAAQNVRNERAQRHGQEVANGNDEVGSYQMVLDAIRILHGSTLGLEIGAIMPGEVRFVRPFAAMLKANASMLAVQFTTTFSIDASGFEPGEADLQDFTTFDAAWDVRPFRDAPAEDLHTTQTLPQPETDD